MVVWQILLRGAKLRYMEKSGHFLCYEVNLSIDPQMHIPKSWFPFKNTPLLLLPFLLIAMFSLKLTFFLVSVYS